MISLSTITKSIGQALQSAPDIDVLWLVGSAAENPIDYHNVDLLAGFSRRDISVSIQVLIDIVKRQLGTADCVISDDSVRFPLANQMINIAAYCLTDLLGWVKDYANGINLSGSHRSWTVGYWLPEALCADLVSARVIYDQTGVYSFFKNLLVPYPEPLAKGISTLCVTEIKQKVDCLGELDYCLMDKIRCQLAKADVVAAIVRLAFAQSRCYLKGFNRLSQQAGKLSCASRRLYELAIKVAEEDLPWPVEIISLIKREVDSE